jgi:diacylglycerol O-acyltransferase / wax synthase
MVQEQLLDLLASRASAVITNVPGPTERLTVAGSPLKQWLSWVSQSGDVGMGVSIFSYAGHVQLGLISDAALTPYPEALVSRFPEEFDKYLYYVLLDLPPAAEGEKKTAPSPRPARRKRMIRARREAVGKVLSDRARARARLASHPHAVAAVRGLKHLGTPR